MPLLVKIFLLSCLAIGPLFKIALIGQSVTYTKGGAVFAVIWNGLFIAAILVWL